MSAYDIRGKKYLLVAFERVGDDWSRAQTVELRAYQDELRKEAKKKEGHTLPQLQKMASARRQRIDEVAHSISAQESGDVCWEPIVIKTIKDYRGESGKMNVTEFNVLFARRARKPDPKVKVGKPAPPPKAKDDKPKAPLKEEKPKDAPPKWRRTSTLNDAFGSTFLFSPDGKPMDANGPIPFENAGLAPGITAERPIGYKPAPKPKEPAPVDAFPPLGNLPGGNPPGILNLDDLLKPEPIKGDIEGIVELPNDRHRDHYRSDDRYEQRPRSRHRRASHVPEDRYSRNVRYSDHYPSSRSSWASDESVILGEWSDLSSRTSEESHYSDPRSPHRKTYRTTLPSRKYYYRDSRLQPGDRVVVENTRRPRFAIEDRRESFGIEDPLPRRSSQSKPILHQSHRPQSRQDIPPEAPHPPTYSREHSYDRRADERRVDDYMRERQREEAQRPSGNRRYSYDPRASRQSGY